MLGFYLDPELTLLSNQGLPKRFSVPLKGGTKTSIVYLGDPYHGLVTTAAVQADTVLELDQTEEFLAPSGSAILADGTVITYTGVTPNTLTGVQGMPVSISIGTKVTPSKVWAATGPIEVFSSGLDKSTLSISLKQVTSSYYNFSGMPLLVSNTKIVVGGAALPIGIQVGCPAGDLDEFVHWYLTTNAFYPQDASNTSTPNGNTPGISPLLFGYLLRRDQQLPTEVRLLPINRSLADKLPGFAYGKYRWRDQDQLNAQVLIPTNWTIDTHAIGDQNFTAGIGFGGDLKPVGLVQQGNSVRLKAERGFYFTGPNDYYWPGTPELEFLLSSNSILTLSKRPSEVYPVFVGTYQLDSQGFYEKSTEFEYLTLQQVASGKEIPANYYTLDRKNSTVTLNNPMDPVSYFVGTISGQPSDYFNLPIYPVDSVTRVYVMYGNSSQVTAVNWSFNRDLGTLVVKSPTGTGPSIPGALQGQMVYVDTNPAVAVLYETADTVDRIVDDVDLNPAFSGISNGYVYLMHSRQEAESLVLSCDKPRINVPATFLSIIGLVAYGPVYYSGDYALLKVTAYSGVTGQTVPNIVLESVVDPLTFTGFLNYQDPVSNPVTVTTGADGTANIIFTPTKNFGLYLPTSAASGSLGGIATTTISNDSLVLPSPGIPISQLWNSKDGWLTRVYSVSNNDPLLGMVGGDPRLGEVVFATSGTPGTFNYKMNGRLNPFLSAANLLQPIAAYDSLGNSYTSPSFTGNVTKLVFSSSLPVSGLVGGYFLSYLQRSLIRFEAVDTNIVSNSILIQMQMPDLISDNPWLYLNDATNGILNQYRLGWTL